MAGDRPIPVGSTRDHPFQPLQSRGNSFSGFSATPCSYALCSLMLANVLSLLLTCRLTLPRESSDASLQSGSGKCYSRR